MTNEEKARELIPFDSGYGSTYDARQAREAAMKMAEWKDQQFKKCLENEIKALQEEYRIWRNSHLSAQIMILQRLKDKLFKEE